MRPVNLIPEESRMRSGAAGDPLVSYGIMGALGLLLIMVVVSIMFSNKAKTLQDQTAALQAEASRFQTKAKPVQSFSDFADVVAGRTLVVGALAQSRFPWHTAFYNIGQAIPSDVVLDTANAQTGASGGGAATAGAAGTDSEAPDGATIDLGGCAKTWVSYAQFTSRLKTMPGVNAVDVESGMTTDSGGGDAQTGAATPAATGAAGDLRKENCGKSPVTFKLTVHYSQIELDLIGLPKIATPAGGASGASGGASGATGAATAAAPPATPAAAGG